MSRGHGKWERIILAAVDASPEVRLNFFRPNSRSGKEALLRAIRRLEEKDEIEIGYDRQGTVVIRRFGGVTSGLKPEYHVVRKGRGYSVFKYYTLTPRPLTRAELSQFLAELNETYGPVPMRSVESLDEAAADAASDFDVDEQLAPEVTNDPWEKIRREVKDLAQESQQPATTRPKKGEWPDKRVEDAEIWEQIGGHGFKTKEYEIEWVEAVNARASRKEFKKGGAKAHKKKLDEDNLANEKAIVEDDATNDGEPEHDDDPARLDLQVERPRKSDAAPKHAYAHDEGDPLESADEPLEIEREKAGTATSDGVGKVADLSPWSKRRPSGYFVGQDKGYHTRAAPPRPDETKAQQVERLWAELAAMAKQRARPTHGINQKGVGSHSKIARAMATARAARQPCRETLGQRQAVEAAMMIQPIVDNT